MSSEDDIDDAVERAVAANGHEGQRVQVPMAFMYRYQGADSADTFDGRVGRCYELALRAHMTFANVGWRTTLVHGAIGPRRNPHAWVEWRDIDGRRWSWDPILDQLLSGSAYRDDFFAATWSRYGPRESARLMERSNGPWSARDCKRAIDAIRAMIAAGSDEAEGLERIKQIMDDNRIKETRNA